MAFILRKVRRPRARRASGSGGATRSPTAVVQYDTAEQAEATVQVSREEGVCLLDLADVEEMPPIQVDKCALAAPAAPCPRRSQLRGGRSGGNVDRQFTFDKQNQGLYNLAFVRCAPVTGTVSFDVRAAAGAAPPPRAAEAAADAVGGTA